MKRLIVMVCVWVYDQVTPFYFETGMELASWTPLRSGNTKLPSSSFLMFVLWEVINLELFAKHFGDQTIQHVKTFGLNSLLTFSKSISFLQEMTWFHLQAFHRASQASCAAGLPRWRCHTASPSVIALTQKCKMTYLTEAVLYFSWKLVMGQRAFIIRIVVCAFLFLFSSFGTGDGTLDPPLS